MDKILYTLLYWHITNVIGTQQMNKTANIFKYFLKRALHFYYVLRAALSPCWERNHLLLHDGKKIVLVTSTLLTLLQGVNKHFGTY
jgi:hypothetical protein